MATETTPPKDRERTKDPFTATPTSEVPLYERVLPVAVLRILVISALVLSLVLIMVGLFDPLRSEHDVARFMLCLAISSGQT